MKIRISEVWNNEGRSVELAVIEVKHVRDAALAVLRWIGAHRPDLQMADSIDAHGFHAVDVPEAKEA